MTVKPKSPRQRDLEACPRGTLRLRGRDAKAEAWRLQAEELFRLANPDAPDVDALAAAIAERPPSAEALVFLLRLAGRESMKAQQRSAAESKNRKAKAWVLEQWDKRDTPEGKAAFSRRIVPLVLERFDSKVSAEWVAREWLPRGEEPYRSGTYKVDPSTGRAVAWNPRSKSPV